MARGRRPPGEDAGRAAFENAEEFAGDDAHAGIGGTRDQKLARKLMNDTGNAERFRIRHGRNLVYVDEIGWLAWTGSHWSAAEGDNKSQAAAQDTAKKIFDEARSIEEGSADLAKKLSGWAVESGNAGRLANMVKLSRSYLAKHVADLDADPRLLNCQNGTLELPREAERSLRLRRHSRLDLITRVLPIGYDPQAAAPRWRAHLAWALPEDDKRNFVQRLEGYLLVGDTSEQAFVFFWGDGANGKSVITTTWHWLLGQYAQVIPFASLVEDSRRRGSEATPEMADLAGARAVFASESNPGNRLDIGRINALTGGETIKVRHLNREFFDLQPRFKLVCSFNNKPIVRDASNGVWRRMKLVPFTQTVPESEVDRLLTEKLQSEGPGILNHMLDGFLLWRERGLAAPEAVTAATREYREDSDPIGNFLDAATARREGALVAARDLYACYEGWCDAGGIKPVTATLFGRLLAGRGIEREKHGTKYYRGIEILAELDFDWRPP